MKIFYCKICKKDIKGPDNYWNIKCKKCGNIAQKKGGTSILLKGLPTVKG